MFLQQWEGNGPPVARPPVHGETFQLRTKRPPPALVSGRREVFEPTQYLVRQLLWSVEDHSVDAVLHEFRKGRKSFGSDWKAAPEHVDDLEQ